MHVGSLEMEGSPAVGLVLGSSHRVLCWSDGFIFIPTRYGLVEPVVTLGFGVLLSGGGPFLTSQHHGPTSGVGVWILLSGDGFIFIPTQNGLVDPMTVLGFGALLYGGGLVFNPHQYGPTGDAGIWGFARWWELDRLCHW